MSGFSLLFYNVYTNLWWRCFVFAYRFHKNPQLPSRQSPWCDYAIRASCIFYPVNPMSSHRVIWHRSLLPGFKGLFDGLRPNKERRYQRETLLPPIPGIRGASFLNPLRAGGFGVHHYQRLAFAVQMLFHLWGFRCNCHVIGEGGRERKSGHRSIDIFDRYIYIYLHVFLKIWYFYRYFSGVPFRIIVSFRLIRSGDTFRNHCFIKIDQKWWHVLDNDQYWFLIN